MVTGSRTMFPSPSRMTTRKLPPATYTIANCDPFHASEGRVSVDKSPKGAVAPAVKASAAPARAAAQGKPAPDTSLPVLERFLGLSVSLNSFTQLVARTRQREEVLRRWSPRAGAKILL